MRTITFKQNKFNSFFVLPVFFIILGVNAQMQNNGLLHVGTNTQLFMKSGNLSFGNAATTTTFRNSPQGVLSIGADATSVTGSATQYVDGWVSKLGTAAFTFPIGQKVLSVNYYAPIKVVPVALSTGVSAAYFRDNTTTIGSTSILDASLAKISALEYWKVTGSNAKLTLTWNASSAVSTMTTFQLADVTIAGYKTSTSKWEAVSSSVDVTSILGGSSSITTGSVTSTADVVLNNYSAFSIGLKGVVCPELVFITGVPISFPLTSLVTSTLNDVVTITAAGATGSFVCNSLVLNADITLLDGQTIEVVNGITGTGKIIMSNQASLVQRATGVEVGKPTIELKKTTRALKQYDYTYFGSPTNGNVLTSLLGAISPTGTLANAFETKYKYVSGAGGGWVALTASPSIGQGYIARVKNQAPFISANDAGIINTTYTGSANNGDINVGILQNAGSLNGPTSHNLLANPYPSALDAGLFLTGNSNIDGVIYIWSQQTASAALNTLYNQADYIAFTKAGSTAIGAANTTPFAGKIASGQGFMVKALASGNVTFTNCMRVTGNNTQFNRVVNETPIIDRYKVNMTGNNGVFSQILVAYLPEGTLGYDRMYDAGRNSVSTAQLYSILENDGRKLAINARPNFAASDVVPLGVSKSGATLESFTLSIQEKEGVFASGTPVYVHDLFLNTYTDLTVSDYTFTSNVAAANNRFEMVYKNGTLNNSSFEGSKAIAYIENGTLSVTATSEIKSIDVYDIMGRIVDSISVWGLNSSVTQFNFSEGIYIAKIKLENGATATQKLINKK